MRPVNSAKKVSDIVAEIAVASQDQTHGIEQAHGYMLELRLSAQQPKQMLPLLSRRDRIAGAPNRQHAIVALLVVKAIGEVAAKIVVADRLAGRELTIAKEEEGLSSPDAINLSRE